MKKIIRIRKLLCMILTLVMAVSILPGRIVKAEEVKPDNGIPVVYLNIDESQGTIDEMLTSPDHTAYCYGTFRVDVPEGFHYCDFPDLSCESISELAMSIRGRGNSTWRNADKKPFKIKLDKETDVFGLGKNKHWVLIANAMDPSLIQDRISAWLGDQMEFEFTPRGVPVDVVMTGENFGTKYLGSYYLSENVRVDTNRLEIDELSVEDTEEPDITGGYLLQNALQVRAGSPDRFYTSRGVDWATHTPSFDTEEDANHSEEVSLNGLRQEENFTAAELQDAYENPVQQTYIQNHIQKIEDALFAGGTSYRDLMDVESAAKYWLVNIFAMNSDAYVTGSTYIYKKRDVNGVTGKLYWGPLWDFDFAWKTRYITDGFAVPHEWLKPMFCDRGEGGFVEEIRKYWPQFRSAVVQLIEEGGIIDQYYEETKASAIADLAVNPKDDEEFDYQTAVEDLKTWITERLAWVDEHIDEVDQLAHEVILMDGEEVYAKYYKGFDENLDLTGAAPEKEGYIFIGWADEEGNIMPAEFTAEKDMVLTAQYVREEDATRAEDIAFRKNNEVMSYNLHALVYQVDYEVVPADAQDRTVIWSMADESDASVDENGLITFKAPGVYKVKASLKNGVERFFTLHVIEGELPEPASIRAEQETVEMKVGEYSVISLITDPEPAKIWEYGYESEDEAVAVVDRYGVITAIGEGRTKIKVTAKSYTDGSVIKTFVTVIVGDAEKFEFDDVKDTERYFYEPVYWAYSHKPQITKGTSEKHFSPDANVTRGQMVTFLWRLAGEPEPEGEAKFNDVKADRYFAKAIAWAAENEITTGYADGSGNFGPDDNCTREQIVTFLWRYAKKPAAEKTAEFTDTRANAYYLDALSWAAENEITLGLNDGTGRFGVGMSCTRAMAVTFLYRVSQK